MVNTSTLFSLDGNAIKLVPTSQDTAILQKVCIFGYLPKISRLGVWQSTMAMQTQRHVQKHLLRRSNLPRLPSRILSGIQQSQRRKFHRVQCFRIRRRITIFILLTAILLISHTLLGLCLIIKHIQCHNRRHRDIRHLQHKNLLHHHFRLRPMNRAINQTNTSIGLLKCIPLKQSNLKGARRFCYLMISSSLHFPRRLMNALRNGISPKD